MPDPKQKSLELPTYLTRYITPWTAPQWMEAERWRNVVRNQPVAALCEESLIRDIEASDWEILAKDSKEEDVLAEHIEYYTDVLNPELPGGLNGFDYWASLMLTDMLQLPIGGNSELVRWPAGDVGPLDRPHAKGHVHKIVYIDGATLYVTYDNQFPIAQKLREDLVTTVHFRRDEIGRMVVRPRPEIRRWGYGMAPPEKIYLAISMLYRGDTYYANLLIDTPEAGLLDLGSMSKDSATEWLLSFRELFTGIDPFKIPVIYETERAPTYIPFNRPPTDLLLDSTTLKYAQITHAGYGLTLTDTGLGDPNKTLAGSIRDERRSRRSGYGVTKEKIKNFIQNEVLPDYLKFNWLERDEEGKTQRSRAFFMATQALAKAKEAGFLTKQEGQAQLIEDGHITVEVERPEEPAEPPPMLAPALPAGPMAQQEAERVPASEGGRGDITGEAVQRADLGDTTITAAPPDSSHFDQLAAIIRHAFSEMQDRAGRPQLMKLIKRATRAMFPDVQAAMNELAEVERPLWVAERLKAWFGEPSEFDQLPDVQKRHEDVLEAVGNALDSEKWWRISPDIASEIALILRLAYSEGATRAAEVAQSFLYTEGLRDTPDLIGFSFDLSNPRTLAEIERNALQLVNQLNEGSKYFIKRIITSGVDEGLASPTIARMIQDGKGIDAILREAGFSDAVVRQAQEELAGMLDSRVTSVVNTEIARAETQGRLGQWGQMGLTRKRWAHTGPDTPCQYCQANIDAGFVPIDHEFESVFGSGVQGPPAHPAIDHCSIEFDEGELMERADTLEVWTGG